MYSSKEVNNNANMIHYYDSLEASDTKLIPLIVCPGLSETADEYLDLLELLSPRRCIVLSFRGRGRSNTPNSGYNLDDHVSDIQSVVNQAGIRKFHLFGYSRGAAYALGYAQTNRDQVKSLILGEYPPEHRAMSSEWPNDYINNYLIPYNHTDKIRPAAVHGIHKESSQMSLESVIEIPVLVARGLLEGSLVDDVELGRYKKMATKLTIKAYFQSGHDIKDTEKKLFYSDIIKFLDSIDQ